MLTEYANLRKYEPSAAVKPDPLPFKSPRGGFLLVTSWPPPPPEFVSGPLGRSMPTKTFAANSSCKQGVPSHALISASVHSATRRGPSTQNSGNKPFHTASAPFAQTPFFGGRQITTPKTYPPSKSLRRRSCLGGSSVGRPMASVTTGRVSTRIAPTESKPRANRPRDRPYKFNGSSRSIWSPPSRCTRARARRSSPPLHRKEIPVVKLLRRGTIFWHTLSPSSLRRASCCSFPSSPSQSATPSLNKRIRERSVSIPLPVTHSRPR